VPKESEENTKKIEKTANYAEKEVVSFFKFYILARALL
jgi:hypothetical protein